MVAGVIPGSRGERLQDVTPRADDPPEQVDPPPETASEYLSDSLLDLDPSLNPIIARPYTAGSRGAAAALYSKEAPALARIGYWPGSDRWEARPDDPSEASGTLWVTYLAKSITMPPRVCSLCGSPLPA